MNDIIQIASIAGAALALALAEGRAAGTLFVR